MIGEMCSVPAYPVRERTTGKPERQTGNMALREIVWVLFLKVSPHSPPLKKGAWGDFRATMKASQVSVSSLHPLLCMPDNRAVPVESLQQGT